MEGTVIVMGSLAAVVVAVVVFVLWKNRSSSTAGQYGPPVPADGAVVKPSGSFRTAAGMVVGDWDQIIGQVSAFYGIPYRRVVAHIMVESYGDPSAVGKAGERGLMQLTPGALADVVANFPVSFTWEDLKAAGPNIQVGTAYLALDLRRLGDLNLASRAYNIGWKTVQRDPTADQVYLNKILSAEQQLQAIGI